MMNLKTWWVQGYKPSKTLITALCTLFRLDASARLILKVLEDPPACLTHFENQ